MFTRVLTGTLNAQWTSLTLPGRHWKWRMRGSAAYFATAHAEALSRSYDVVLASSYVPLAELVGLCPALARVPRVLYFHENQLAFPVRGAGQARDHHFGFTQLVSALAADRCLFNSAYNRDSFLAAASELLARMPDAVPPDWVARIADRAQVVPVPVPLTEAPVAPAVPHRDGPLLLWNHRWEYDKNPATCFEALQRLAESGVPFRLAVCGQRFRTAPPAFERARRALASRLVHWGEATREDYVALLDRADIVMSTAHHEFFGVSVVEAVHHGARPVVPDRLSYPEIWPQAFRYPDDDGFGTAMGSLLERGRSGEPLRADRRTLTRPYAASQVVPRIEAALESVVASARSA